ncbi:hypothetical protein PsorP6_017900 [Peronosclerospora sorghi]|uniref:Uncharacterized protein n=1 Tax=Peronosclerospora sorghi TaxID=230839 RepID=A0ACC0WE19_9STRA|nr:hypothetical protein PsorP6_017900 [Peronosclerospora sorghi]
MEVTSARHTQRFPPPNPTMKRLESNAVKLQAICVYNRVNNVANEANEGLEEVDGAKGVAVAHTAKHCGRKETTER